MANEFVRYFSSSFQPFVWVLSGPVLLHHTARPCKEMEDVLRKKKPMNVEKAAWCFRCLILHFGAGDPLRGAELLWRGGRSLQCGAQSAPLTG